MRRMSDTAPAAEPGTPADARVAEDAPEMYRVPARDDSPRPWEFDLGNLPEEFTTEILRRLTIDELEQLEELAATDDGMSPQQRASFKAANDELTAPLREALDGLAHGRTKLAAAYAALGKQKTNFKLPPLRNATADNAAAESIRTALASIGKINSNPATAKAMSNLRASMLHGQDDHDELMATITERQRIEAQREAQAIAREERLVELAALTLDATVATRDAATATHSATEAARADARAAGKTALRFNWAILGASVLGIVVSVIALLHG